jgi:DNA-binding transcriptional MerR regulator
MKEKSLTPGEAAELIDVSRKTPRHWRHTGYGPPLSKSKGRKIRCPEGPLQA